MFQFLARVLESSCDIRPALVVPGLPRTSDFVNCLQVFGQSALCYAKAVFRVVDTNANTIFSADLANIVKKNVDSIFDSGQWLSTYLCQKW